MQQAQDDSPPDSTTVHDAALFLYETRGRAWQASALDLRQRPATAAFLARHGVVSDGSLTLAGRALVHEVVRRAQSSARTDLGRRAEAARALKALLAEHAAPTV